MANIVLHKWIEANRCGVDLNYRQFKAVEPPPGSNAILAWRGSIQPFPDSRELERILDDLEVESRVTVLPRGGLQHDALCPRTDHSALPYMDRLTHMNVSFELLVLAFVPPKDPCAIGIFPEISHRILPFHPHLRDGFYVFTRTVRT